MVDTVYCTIHVRSMQAKCIMILYVTLNQDNELGPTRILRIYNHVLYTLCTVHITGMYVRRIMFFWRIIGGLGNTIWALGRLHCSNRDRLDIFLCEFSAYFFDTWGMKQRRER